MTKSLLRALGGIVVLVVAWQALAMGLDKSVVPAPTQTLRTLVELVCSGEIVVPAGQTAWKVLVALLLAVLVGIPVGLALGLSEPLYDLFRPILMVIQAVPVISWLSVVIFAWGIGWKGPVFIAFLSLVPISVLTTVSGVRSLDKNLLEMARLYRVPRRRVLWDIYLGSLLPFTAAILDVSVGQAWKVILVTEYLCGGSGMGVRILMARMNIDFAETWALTLIAVTLGIATDRLIKMTLGSASRRWTSA